MYFKTQTFKHFSWAFLVLLLLSSPLLFIDKSFLSLWLNEQHTPFLDQFFKYLTHLGNAWFLVPLLLFSLSRNYFLSLILVISAFVESILVQLVLKQGFFADVVRPIKYIAQSELLHRVEGVEIHALHSFPSGHAQTTFLFFTFLALFFKRSSMAYVLLFLAALTALSRVYLLQHFFIDIWFGALIGYLFPIIIGLAFYKYSKLALHPKWNRGFLSK